MHTEKQDADAGKGAVDQDKPEQTDNTSLSGQLPHRPDNKLIEGNDTDFPEPGSSPEHSGEPVDTSMEQRNEQAMNRKPEENPEGKLQDQDPGHRQKQNQSDKKDDDLAA